MYWKKPLSSGWKPTWPWTLVGKTGPKYNKVSFKHSDLKQAATGNFSLLIGGPWATLRYRILSDASDFPHSSNIGFSSFYALETSLELAMSRSLLPTS